MTRVIRLLEGSVAALAVGVVAIFLWTVASPITIHVSHAFAGTVSSLTPDEQQITAALTAFGAQEQNVNVMAADASSTIAAIYAPYVDPALLAQWESDPTSAPGRVVSSPWPDHIQITSVTPQGAGYIVDGELVFMTNSETGQVGNAGTTPVVVQIEKENGGWMIVAFQGQSQKN